MADPTLPWTELSFPPLTRTQLALFAGGSGDHNPLHVDSDAARAAGFDDVFAQGMLPMALLGRALTGRVAPQAVVSLDARFTAICHVGDALTVTAVSVGPDGGDPSLTRLSLVARTADGRLILEGAATVREDT